MNRKDMVRRRRYSGGSLIFRNDAFVAWRYRMAVWPIIPALKALGLAADVIDQLAFLLFFFVIDKFHLDKFVFFQSGIDGGNDFGRQTVFSDQEPTV